MKRHVIKKALTLMPKTLMSKAIGAATHWEVSPSLHRTAATLFAKAMHIDVEEYALQPDECATFADYFARPLKEGARPIAEGDDAIISPVDAKVSCFGDILDRRMIQAKGRDYSVAALLDNPEMALKFTNGSYITLYLSPRDYHRIHAPMDGDIRSASVIPGELFPVNAPSVRTIPNLFCVNERLITYLATKAGIMAVVKVGATCVGSVKASYCNLKTRDSTRVTEKNFVPPIPIHKGEELGRFELGSTVILLFQKDRIRFDSHLVEGMTVQMGQSIAQAIVPEKVPDVPEDNGSNAPKDSSKLADPIDDSTESTEN